MAQFWVEINMLYPPILIEQGATHEAKVRADVAILKIRVGHADEDVTSTEESLRQSEADPEHSAEEVARIRLKFEQAKAASRQLSIDLAELERDGTIAVAALQVLEKRMKLMGTLLFFGIVVMVVGFVLWYVRVQTYADEILRLQAYAARSRAKASEQSTPQDTSGDT